jgi:hypothetical protein
MDAELADIEIDAVGCDELSESNVQSRTIGEEAAI